MARATARSNVKRAKNLRYSMALPEVLLWQILRAKPAGLKFRRQHPVGPYVVDFYCPAGKVAFEIDGIAHDMGNRPERDEARAAELAARGLTIVRIPAQEVLGDAPTVAQMIIDLCQGPSTSRYAAGPPPHSLHEQGGL